MSETSETLDALHTQLQQQTTTQKLLLEITQRIASSGSLDDMLRAICDAAQRGLQANGACIVLGTNQAEAGYVSDGPLSTPLSVAGPMLLTSISQNGALEVSDVAAATLDKLALGEIKALVVLPLMAHNARQGIIAVGYATAHLFSDDERGFLSIVAGQTAVAVENAQAYQVVRQSQEQLSAILASTADPVIVIDAQEMIVLLNPAAERALDVDSRTASGKRFGDVIDAEPLLYLLRDSANSDSLEWQSKAGQTYAPHVSEITADDARRRGRILILRDITRYKNLHANQTEFVSTVSHDLRSPLTYMQGWATMLPMFGEMNTRQKEAIDKIIIGIVQMTDLIDKVLDAGRLDPETGYYELMREPCDVSKMANEVVDTHLQPAEKKGLKLLSDIDPNLPVLNLDDLMLRRALNNLVDNAVKYTPTNGTITVAAHVEVGNLVLSVKDTGRGISDEDQKHIWRRFDRGHDKEARKVKGSGLGLFIVKNVAEKHGGDATVKSKLGDGATFFIHVPMAGANLIGAESKADKKADQA